ncbi:MAG: hypothetical protein AB1510_02455 [Bacillota bacterium]
MPFQIPLMDILSPVQDENEAKETSTKSSFMKRVAARFDLSVFDLWIVVFTIVALAAIYGIGELASVLSG